MPASIAAAAVIYSALTGQPWVVVTPQTMTEDATRPPLEAKAGASESIRRHGDRARPLADACTIRDEAGRAVGGRLSCQQEAAL